jgi:hypothetical protein
MAYMRNSPFRKGCAKSEGGSGCIVERNGQWVILNNKKPGNKIWKKCGKGPEGKNKCKAILGGYHANKK